MFYKGSESPHPHPMAGRTFSPSRIAQPKAIN